GLYGVTIDSSLHNIDVQAGTFDLENTTSGSLGDSTGTLTLENGSELIFYSMLNPISKPTVFESALLSNNNGPVTFNGPVAFNDYLQCAMYASSYFNGTISGSVTIEVEAGSGTFGIGGTNNFTGDIYLDNNVGPFILSGQGVNATGAIYPSPNDSVT